MIPNDICPHCEGKAIVGHKPAPSMSRERLIGIIKASELWRMSNYVGRDKKFTPDEGTGTELLADAIMNEMEGE
jgi:hypothetical protein